MSKSKKDTVFSLAHSRLSHAFDDGESFWADEIRRIYKLVRLHMQDIDGHKSEELMDDGGHFRKLLSVALFGTYGSGKSSLLRTFVKRMNTEGKCYKDIHSLHVIEPVLLGEGNFLYAFLAEALERERDISRKRTGHYEHQTHSPLVRRVQEMGEFFQAVDKERNLEEDPIGASLGYLYRQTSALRLQEKMNKFLDEMADELTGSKNGVVILPIDDADMAPVTLVETLQIYRRYLQHPRLIPIFTFTGRVAEELLRAHFEKELNLGDRDQKYDAITEVSTQINIAENLAIQYLGKLFPIRNRIKLGVAAARAQGARYRPSDVEGKQNSAGECCETEGSEKKQIGDLSVFKLLKQSSTLLFGNHLRPLVPEIRAPLRSATLRRQMQIIDVMDAAEITKVFKKQEDPKNIALNASFAQVYGVATWSLLNIHRDALKDLKLHLDDLYSWTADGLQRAILISILKLELNVRRDILNHWVYGTEERRSLMLSLLAANAFRPQMYPEEPTGDNPNQVSNYEKSIDTPLKPGDKRILSFSCQKGILWFLNLWHGFYLPQVLARDRPSTLKVPEKNLPVSGIGWSITSAPVHAIREALKNNRVSSVGMLFLEPQEFADNVQAMENKNEDNWLSLSLDIWCYYGIDRGQNWAAISFWRGLGLIGQIIQASIDLSEKTNSAEEDEASARNIDEEYNVVFKNIIYNHLRSAHVLGKPKEKKTKSDASFLIPPEWGQWRYHPRDEVVAKLAKELTDWVKNFNRESWRISPLDKSKKEHCPCSSSDSSENAEGSRAIWKGCFIRRMHGDHLVGHFLHDLQNPSPGEATTVKGKLLENNGSSPPPADQPKSGDPPAPPVESPVKDDKADQDQTKKKRKRHEPELVYNWSARHALSKWLEVLFKYWNCGKHVFFQHEEDSAERTSGNYHHKQNRTLALLGECPILKPFIPYPLYHMKHYAELQDRVSSLFTSELQPYTKDQKAIIVKTFKSITSSNEDYIEESEFFDSVFIDDKGVSLWGNREAIIEIINEISTEGDLKLDIKEKVLKLLKSGDIYSAKRKADKLEKLWEEDIFYGEPDENKDPPKMKDRPLWRNGEKIIKIVETNIAAGYVLCDCGKDLFKELKAGNEKIKNFYTKGFVDYREYGHFIRIKRNKNARIHSDLI